MWASDQVVVEIEEAERSEVIVTIATPLGILRLMPNVSIVDRTLRMNRAHAEGLKPGALGRAGLNAIGRKLLELADVDEIIIQGSTRTTGRNPGTIPRPIRFPRKAVSHSRQDNAACEHCDTAEETWPVVAQGA
jgi:hypothetical protein